MDSELRARVEAHTLWYHALELAPGVVTPGWFDLRPILQYMPWPDVAGKRCLDIGTWDGCLAFELERRGAAEVVATDIRSHTEWDHLPRDREGAIAFHEGEVGEKGAGFVLAAEALGSKVQREWINVYDISPERLGTFDVVVCGSLLLHLECPFKALDAIRSVCGGSFLSAEQVDPAMTLLLPKRAAAFIEGKNGRWTVPNAAGHARMLEIAGFDPVRRSGPYAIPFGPNHPARQPGLRARLDTAVKQVVARGRGGDGVLHSAVLCSVA